MLSPRSSSRLRGRALVARPSASATSPSPAQAQADSADATDRDYVEAESEEDDETTLEKEEREAAAAGEQTAEEVAALQQESDLPLEDILPPELLAAYGLDQDDDSEEEEGESPAPSPSAATAASSPSEQAVDSATEAAAKPVTPSTQTATHRSSERLAAARKQQSMEVDDSDADTSESDDEGDATARLLDDREPLGSGQVADKALVLDGARTEEERVMMAAAQASAAQPQGFTLASTKVKTKVPFLLRGTLREYQHIGLDWLVSMYNNGLNGILADEMGLGKTIMTISTLASLACEKGIWGQHLIVVPTSVIINWEMEFKRWLPGFKILTYYGNQKQRRDKRRGWNDPNAFHVCITSYQLVLRDRKIFGRKKWHYLILDEAHHIKNFASQKWQVLIQFSTFRRLLLTGTPLQNNLMELWSLMHFLMPHVFQSQKEFKAWFANPVTSMSEGKEQVNQQIINRLHGVLRPFLLRRLKRDVEQQLPKKYEHVIMCRLSKRQRQLYEDFMANAGTKETLAGSNFLGLMNVLMQLRKVCNHPDLFEGRPIISPFDQIRPLLYSTSSAATQATDLGPFQAISRPLLHALVALHANRTVPSLCDATWAARDITELRTPSHLIAIAGASLPESLSTPPELPVDLSSGPPVPRSLQMQAFAVPSLNLNSGMSAWQSYWHGRIQQRQEARQARFSHVDYLNRLRCETIPPLPVYPPNLLRTLQFEHPVFDIHSIAADPSRYLDYSSALCDAIRLPAQRSNDMLDILTRFVCFIPRARAPPIEMHVSHPSSSQQTDKEVLETALETSLSPLCEPFHVPNIRTQVNFPDKRLLQWDCGKLQALDRLLRKLKAEGHRVLIFTQMTRMLDILEAFLNVCGYNYLRLDGATKVEDRQRLMERFNTDSRMFCFILSTRSGGIGINLTGADTVVFYDTDWNPSMDQQAQDRCHRIGQTREVHVYRLVTESTVEENILKKSHQKQFMNNMVIGDGQFNTEFFDKLDPRELLGLTKINDFLPPAGQDTHINTYALPRMRVDRAAMELAMSRAEDPSDRIAAKKLQDEQAADSAEMDADEGAEESGRSRLPRLDVESDMSPIEQYAMRFAEIVDPVIKDADRAQVENDLRSQERKWQDDRQRKQHLAPPSASAVKMETDESSSSAAAGPSGDASGSDPSAPSSSTSSNTNAAFSLYGNPMHPNSIDSTASRQCMGQSFGRFRPGVISELAMKLDRQARQEAEAAGYYLSDEDEEEDDFFYVPPSRSAAASSSSGPAPPAPSASAAEDDMDGQAAFRAQVEHMQSQDMKYDPEMFAPPSSPREDEWYSASVVEKSRELYQREDSWWGLLATPQDLTRMMRQREKKPPPPPARPLLTERERRLGMLGLSSRPGHNFRTIETPSSFRIRIPTKLIRNYVPLRLQKGGVPSTSSGATPIKRERTGPPGTGLPSKSLVGGSTSDSSASKGGGATYGTSSTPSSAQRKKDPKAPLTDPTKGKKDGKADGKLVKKDDKTATTPAKAGATKAKTAGGAATAPDSKTVGGAGVPPSAPGAASPAVPEERHRVAWTRDEDALLVVAVEDFGPNWTLIADILRHYPQVTGRLRSPQECQQEYIRRTGRDPAASASATPNTKEEKALLMEERAGAVGAGVGGLRATTRERSRGRITAGLKRRRPEDVDSGASSSPDPGSSLKKRSTTPSGGASSSSSALAPRAGDKSRDPVPPPPRDPFGFGTDTLRHYVNIAMKQINSAKIMVRESLRVQTLEMESTAMWQTRSHASHKKALTDAHARLGLPAHALGKTLMPHQIIQLRGRRAPVIPPAQQTSVIMTAPPPSGMPLTVNVPPNYTTNPPPMNRYPSQPGANPSGMPVMSMGSSGMAVSVPVGTPGASGPGAANANRSGSMMPMMVSNPSGQPAPMMPYRSPTSTLPGSSQVPMTPGMNMMPGSAGPGTPSMVMMRSTSSGAPNQPNLSAPSPTHTGQPSMASGMQSQSGMSSGPGGAAGSSTMRTMTMPMNPQGSPTRTAPGYATMTVSGQPGVSMSMTSGGMSVSTHQMQQPGGSSSVTVTPMGQMPAMSMTSGPNTPSQGKKNGPKQNKFAKGTPGVMSLPIQNVGMAMGPGTAPAMSTGMASNMQSSAVKKTTQPQPSTVGGSAQTVKPGMSMTIPGNSGSTTMTMPPTLVMAPQSMTGGRQMQGTYYMPIDPKSSAGNRSPSPNSATSSMMTQQYQISIQPGSSQGQRPAMTYALNVAPPSGSVPTSQSPGPQQGQGQPQSSGMSTGQMGQGGQAMRYTTSDQNTYITMAPSAALAPGSMNRGQSTGTGMTIPQSNQSSQPNQANRTSTTVQQMPGYAYSVSAMARPTSSGTSSTPSNSSLSMTYSMSGQPSATESSASFSSSAAAPGALSAGYAQTGSRPPPAHAQLSTFVGAVVNAYPALKDNVNNILTRSDLTDEQKMHSISRLYTSDKGSSGQQNSSGSNMAARPQGSGQPSYNQPGMPAAQQKK